MLMIPVLVLLSMEYPAWGVFTSSALTSIILIFILVPFVAAFITTHDRDDKHRNYYAGLKVGGGFWWKYLITTAVYMISYEILMRGVLLHYLLDKMGVFYAIALNTLIYSGMHLVKNKQEALLSVPLGVLLCWMTIYTRSIWPAAFFHLVMAVSFEFYYSMKK
jgi:membrane protease YdiL (CAAX protease family)